MWNGFVITMQKTMTSNPLKSSTSNGEEWSLIHKNSTTCCGLSNLRSNQNNLQITHSRFKSIRIDHGEGQMSYRERRATDTHLRRSRVRESPLDIPFKYNPVIFHFLGDFILDAAIVRNNHFNLIFLLLMCWETVSHNCVLTEENSKQMKYFKPSTPHDQHLT